MSGNEACGAVSVPIRPSGFEVRDLYRPLEFFDSNLDKPCLNGALCHAGTVFCPLVPVKGNCKAVYKDIISNCVLPTL